MRRARSAPKSHAPGDLGERRRPLVARAEDRAVRLRLGQHLLGRLFAAHDRRRVHHRVDQRLVAGAAAEVAVAVEPRAHLLARRRLVVVEQHLRRHDETRRADAALRAAMRHPGDLQRMQFFRRADAFDRDDLGARRELLDGGLTAAVRLAVDDHRARAALAVFTADLATRQQHLLAQDVGEGGGLLGDDPAVDAVHIQ